MKKLGPSGPRVVTILGDMYEADRSKARKYLASSGFVGLVVEEELKAIPSFTARPRP